MIIGGIYIVEDKEFVVQLSNLLKARFPCLYITSWEEDRLLSLIKFISNTKDIIKTPRNVFVWKVTTGLVNENSQKQEKSRDPLSALDFVGKYDEPGIFVFLDFHVYFGGQGSSMDPTIIRKIRDVADILKQSPQPKNIIFISPTLVLPIDLQKDVSIVDFDLPSLEGIKNLLEDMITVNQRNHNIIIKLDENEKERLAKAALGLTLQEAENAFARAMVEGGPFDINKLDEVLEEKRQIIKKTEILEFIRPNLSMEDVGGLENLKNWLKKRNNSWLDSSRLYGISAPKGVLITGVPGCGKSLIVKAISAMWQLPLLRLDMGKIFSGVVGSSEENMRKALQISEATSPCILWIDEVEKGFSGSEGDGGTSSRVFGTFLTWIQEKTKPVFVAATANNIHVLPSEFLRKGRFDEIFFVDLPTHRERKDIFNIHIKKRLKSPDVIGDFVLDDEVLQRLSDITEGYVGAEIEQIVVVALFEAFSESRSITLDDFEKAVKETIPLSVTQAEQIRAIREWAELRAVAATKFMDRVDYHEFGKLNLENANINDGIHDDISSTRGGRAIDF